MTLRQGYRFATAARFNLRADWAARLRLGAAVEDPCGAIFPRGPWTELTLAELAVLVGEAAPGAPSLHLPLIGEGTTPAPADDPDAITLFQLPMHLRSAWWDLLDGVAASGGPLSGFDGFAARVIDFLNFKHLLVPAGARVEAVITAAGERSIQRDPATGGPAGMGPTAAGAGAGPRLWGVVNLGDEDTSLVLVNLPLERLAAEFDRQDSGTATPTTIGELAVRFFRAHPNYPLVRLRLGPGEGCRLPAGGLILDGDPSVKTDPDTLLLISDDGSSPGLPAIPGDGGAVSSPALPTRTSQV